MLKILNKILICLILILGIWYFYDQLSNGIYDGLLLGLFIIPTLLGPWIIKKLFHYQMCNLLKFCYYIFVLLGLVLGSIMGFYKLIPYYDKFVHFLSGIISSVVALIFLKEANTNTKKTPIWFQMFFILCFSLFIASFWEFLEFFYDKITGADSQYVMKTGVDDTMTDMLVAFLGSILFSIYYWYQLTKSKINKIELIEKYF